MRVKYFVVLFVIAVLLYLGFRFFAALSFKGMFDRKYSREELTEYFNQHENDFSDLVESFAANIPKNKQQSVSFGLSKNNKISLNIYPSVIDSASKIIGGNDLELGSPLLDTALATLGWTNETIVILRNKLSKTNCDWIRTTENINKPVEIYPNQSGMSSYSYSIYNKPIDDSLISTYGKPLSKSEFGSRVTLTYTSVL